MSDELPTLWLVDGFNLLHAAVLRGRESRARWWRAENRARVVALARGFDDPCAELVVVFDREGEGSAPGEPSPRVVHAPSADAWILAAVREAPEPARIAVVTADRELASGVRAGGASVVSPTAFAARCRQRGS